MQQSSEVSPANSINVLLAISDNPTYAEGMELLLGKTLDFKVIGIATNSDEVIAKTKQLLPNVLVLVGTELPGLDVAEITRYIRTSHLQTRTILLTPETNEDLIVKAIRAGVDGYLSTKVTPEELVNFIRVLNSGTVMFDSRLGSEMLKCLFIDAQTVIKGDRLDGLSVRQLEILRLASDGMTNKTIGNKLDISDRTVQAHLHSAFSKIGVTSRTEAVATAIERGWLTRSATGDSMD